MAAQVKWQDDTKKILIFTFEGYWILADFYDVFKQSNTLLDNLDYKVNMIIDIRDSKSLPTGFFSALRTVSKQEHPNAGKVAMVGMNTFTRAFVLAVRQVMRKKPEDQWMQIVASYEDAYKLFAAAETPTKETPVTSAETQESSKVSPS
jgi:hypothetical protein